MHGDLMIAKERFKNMIFRYRVSSKVAKMKEFNKDSYEFLRANLEL